MNSAPSPVPGALPTVLEVTDLCISYGKVEALHRVNIRVEPGQIVTVIGPNGAGKTTMLAAVMGLLKLSLIHI